MFDYRTLILVPNISLLTQTVKEFKKFGFDVCGLGAGNKEITSDIVISTKQTFSKLKTDFQPDVIIIDETHVGFGTDGDLYNIMIQYKPSVKIGLTATLPNNDEAKMNIEGLVGNVIDSVSIQEGSELEILAEPYVYLIPVPTNESVNDHRSYNEVYDAGIVYNNTRNEIIIKKCHALNKKGISVLIFITKIAHGEELAKLAERLGMPFAFVRGSTEAEAREDLKSKMETQEIKTIISSVVWREGVNIKSLGAVAIAGGGKTSSGIIQSIGRCLRKTESKHDAIILDFLDAHKWLAQHCVERIKIYVEMGWL